MFCALFFFNDTATTEIYTYCHTLSLHDALPISLRGHPGEVVDQEVAGGAQIRGPAIAIIVGAPAERIIGPGPVARRSEEHTSELQSLMRISYAVFCLKKKNQSIS